jgi:hypothetical protein
MSEQLTDDDQQRLAAIMDAMDPEQRVKLVLDYYHDADRANRTSRQMMYLHMGMLSGMIMRLLDLKPKTVSWGDTREKSE